MLPENEHCQDTGTNVEQDSWTECWWSVIFRVKSLKNVMSLIKVENITAHARMGLCID